MARHVFLGCVGVALGVAVSLAQAPAPKAAKPILRVPKLEPLDPALESAIEDAQRRRAGVIDDLAVKPTLVADVTAVEPGKSFTLGVRFDVPQGYYFYYQSPGGVGLPTRIEFAGPAGFEVGPPQFPGPDVKYEDELDPPVANYVYKHSTVILTTVTPPKDLARDLQAEFSAKVRFQFCKEGGACYNHPPATLTFRLPVASGPSQPSENADAIAAARRALPTPGDRTEHLKVRAVLSADRLRPGDRAEQAVVVEVEPGLHVQQNRPPSKDLVSTDLILDAVPGVAKFPLPNYPPPLVPLEPMPGFEGVGEYRGQFVIRVPVVAQDSLQGERVRLSGLVRFQACEDGGGCYPPAYASFSTDVPVAEPGSPVRAVEPELFAAALESGGPVAAAPSSAEDLLANLRVVEGSVQDQPLWQYVIWAFLGGLFLNVMPCVLPVIAIKIMSFVRQAGESLGRILLLNVCYSLGIVSVFLVLATFAVVAQVGWGGLFQRAEFNLFMAALVFAMGLSLLGVFEIPVPGMIGSAAGPLQREGLPAAFLTGVLATLLATPCSGPFLGVTLGWSVQQPPQVTYLVWATMGLGMASPYLLIGACPSAITLIPKPGNWMVRFKEFSGFVLMGTVVFIITFLEQSLIFPCLVMLVGLGLGLWMIGHLYDINSPPSRKLSVRLTASVLSAAICLFAFTTVRTYAEEQQQRRMEKWLSQRGVSGSAASTSTGRTEGILPWQPFSEDRLLELLAQRKTVLLDFTADW